MIAAQAFQWATDIEADRIDLSDPEVSAALIADLRDDWDMKTSLSDALDDLVARTAKTDETDEIVERDVWRLIWLWAAQRMDDS